MLLNDYVSLIVDVVWNECVLVHATPIDKKRKELNWFFSFNIKRLRTLLVCVWYISVFCLIKIDPSTYIVIISLYKPEPEQEQKIVFAIAVLVFFYVAVCSTEIHQWWPSVVVYIILTMACLLLEFNENGAT